MENDEKKKNKAIDLNQRSNCMYLIYKKSIIYITYFVKNEI